MAYEDLFGLLVKITREKWVSGPGTHHYLILRSQGHVTVIKVIPLPIQSVLRICSVCKLQTKRSNGHRENEYGYFIRARMEYKHRYIPKSINTDINKV